MQCTCADIEECYVNIAYLYEIKQTVDMDLNGEQRTPLVGKGNLTMTPDHITGFSFFGRVRIDATLAETPGTLGRRR